MKEWWEKGRGLYPSCPDFALLSPHRIVFEGKLFREGGDEKAKSEIVHGVYECVFIVASLLCLTDEMTS